MTCSPPSLSIFGLPPPSSPPSATAIFIGRGTADDKGQVHIHIKALEALKKPTGKLPINVKVMIEGEEEVGSVSLWDFVQRNRERLKADALVVSDTSMLAKGVPSITYGLRGLNYYQIEITGPAQDLHSGVFGGAVPNPITILAEMIAKLHDKNFRVTVPGFYDDVAQALAPGTQSAQLAPVERKRISQDRRRARLCGEKGFTIVEQLWTRPTLELNGIWGGYTGEGAKTVIPAKAYAKFSTRLVPNQDPAKIAKLVERHIRALLAEIRHCKFEVLSTGKPWVAPYSHPIFQKRIHALEARLRQKSRFHSRRRIDSFRHADARHLQSSLRPAGLWIARRKRACPRRTHRAGKLFRRNQGRRAFLRAARRA